MTLNYVQNERRHEINCDMCPEAEELDVCTFAQALEEAKEKGWRPHRSEETGEWLHLCESCAEDILGD